jgi:hypothetical protein
MISKPLVSPEWIEQSILELRDHKVMLDLDVAALYGVKTRVLTQSARRNVNRFPPSFMFQLTKDEFDVLRSYSMNTGQRGGRRYPPFAFTAQGVAMASTVLRSPRATRVSVEIVRGFLEMRQALGSQADLSGDHGGALQERYDYQTQAIFDAIRQLMSPAQSNGRESGR